ncbi:amidase domain-containing protein [Dictyobacter arantiisoli]
MFSGNAFAYNRPNIINYVGKWAKNRNGFWPSYGSDCTIFLSQSMNAGRDGMDGTWHAQYYL